MKEVDNLKSNLPKDDLTITRDDFDPLSTPSNVNIYDEIFVKNVICNVRALNMQSEVCCVCLVCFCLLLFFEICVEHQVSVYCRMVFRLVGVLHFARLLLLRRLLSGIMLRVVSARTPFILVRILLVMMIVRLCLIALVAI